MWRRERTGDAGSRLGELYREHSAAVFAYAFHLLGSHEEAEDVTQVAFLQAHRALRRGEDLVSPRAWLSTVVKRQAYNRWRDRTPTTSDADLLERPQDAARDAAERLAEVRAVLFSLPEAQHQAFVLRHWSGLGPREIAEVLGTTESAVESLLVRARSAVVSSGPVDAACVEIREHLASGADLMPIQRDHVRGCRGCGRAHERLTRIAAAAVVLGLVPRVHVAQALAATVPGFATAGGGAGAATGAGVAAKATAAKLAASLIIGAVAVTTVAPAAWHHLRDHGTASGAHPAINGTGGPRSDRSGSGGSASGAHLQTGEDIRGASGPVPTAATDPPRLRRSRRPGTGASPTAGTTPSGDDGSAQDTGGTGQSDAPTAESGDAGNSSGDGSAQGGDGGGSTTAGDGSGSGSTDTQGSGGSPQGSQSGGGSGDGAGDGPNGQ